jgi:predicted lipoprotein
MKLRILLATGAVLALAACGKSATPPSADAGATAAAASTDSAAASVEAAAGGAPTKEYMIGKWADVKDGDCKLAQEFKADGKVEGLFDSWKLNGSVLTVTMMGENKDIAVKVIDAKTLETKIAGAEPHKLTRC